MSSCPLCRKPLIAGGLHGASHCIPPAAILLPHCACGTPATMVLGTRKFCVGCAPREATVLILEQRRAS